MGRALAITGLGCIGAPGAGLDAQRAALADGRCGLATIEDPHLPLASRLPVGRVVADLVRLPSRTAALAATAGLEALAGLPTDLRRDCAVIVGTSVAGLTESERDFLGRDRTRAFPSYRRQQSHRVGRMLAAVFDCHGLQSTHAVACASAATAIAEAAELVRSGLTPLALAIGADSLSRVTMAGFNSLHLIDPQGCRPLTVQRGGMSLGEGAGALLIEDADHARRRGARPVASLLGWGQRADGHHATSPDPLGRQLEQAIRDALADAALAPAAIGYASAHGTGTADNDPCELQVLSRIFGAIPTASCKRVYGHTLGASAALEAVASCLALRDRRLWANAGGIGDPLSDVEVVTRTRDAAVQAVCSTTLAFGGVNAALIFATAEHACA